jgi:hypothetical protein
MAQPRSVYGCRGGPVPHRCGNGRWRAFGRLRIRRSGVVITTLVFLCTGSAAHPPEAEFADWFHSLKEPGTEGTAGSGVSCCSPASDCQITDYETDAEGRYWVTAEGERIQVPPEKILQRADNPTGRGVACLRHDNGHPVVRCFVRASEG